MTNSEYQILVIRNPNEEMLDLICANVPCILEKDLILVPTDCEQDLKRLGVTFDKSGFS